MSPSRWIVLFVLLLTPLSRGQGNVPLPRFPAISPDGETIVFGWAGDLWQVPADGGEARRLTAHPGEDRLPQFSPDGSRIAFTSDRYGPSGLFTMDADGSNVVEALVVDRAALLTDFGDDGKLYFTGYHEPDVYRNPRPYSVDAAGGVHERLHDAFGRSPVKEIGGARFLFVRGNADLQRRGERGPDTRDIWMWDGGAFTQLTDRRGNDARPQWLGSDRFVFTSDRENATVNLYVANIDGGNVTPLTDFSGRDVEDYDVTPDGRTIVFARWDKLYVLDVEGGEPREVEIRATQDALAEKVVTDHQPRDRCCCLTRWQSHCDCGIWTGLRPRYGR